MVLKHLEVSMPIETGQAGVLTLHDYISWLVVIFQHFWKMLAHSVLIKSSNSVKINKILSKKQNNSIVA